MTPKRCRICGEAHGYTTCPEPLRFPSTPIRDDESEKDYHRRLRYNAYMAAFMRSRPDIKAKRMKTLEEARKTPGSSIHANEKARSRRKAKRRSEMLATLKNVPCMDCGGVFPPCVMDFDHRDPSTKTKRFRSPGMMAARTSLAEFEAEIAKCDLVCANCHRIRTHLGRRPPASA